MPIIFCDNMIFPRNFYEPCWVSFQRFNASIKCLIKVLLILKPYTSFCKNMKYRASILWKKINVYIDILLALIDQNTIEYFGLVPSYAQKAYVLLTFNVVIVMCAST